MYRNILLPSGYNEFISICVSYISCPSLVLMSRYILADGQKENNNGFRFVFLPPLSGPAQYCSLKGDFFQLAGVELHHPVLRSPRYSPVSTVGAQVRLTHWLTDTFPRFQRFFSPFLPPAQSRLWSEFSVNVENISRYQAGHHHFRLPDDAGRQVKNKLFYWIIFSRQIWRCCRQL